MSIRDDLTRLVNYAKGLGFSVSFRRAERGSRDAGYFVYSSSPEIVVLVNSRTSYRDRVLTLLHEIGHGRDWIARGRPAEAAVEFQFSMDEDKMTADDRKVILAAELRAIHYMLVIYRELELTLDEKFVKLEMEFDRWIYRWFARRGTWPTTQQAKDKKKQLMARFNLSLT